MARARKSLSADAIAAFLERAAQSPSTPRPRLTEARFSAKEVAGLGRTDALRLAMQAQKPVAWDYTRKRDGMNLHYVARPYSVRRKRGQTLLYATEGKHGHAQIHSFILSRITNAEVKGTAPSFDAVWPTEPDTV